MWSQAIPPKEDEVEAETRRPAQDFKALRSAGCDVGASQKLGGSPFKGLEGPLFKGYKVYGIEYVGSF